jgi:hypothetical protein
MSFVYCGWYNGGNWGGGIIIIIILLSLSSSSSVVVVVVVVVVVAAAALLIGVVFNGLKMFIFIYYEQDRQCTCDVTLRRVYETIVAVEKP